MRSIYRVISVQEVLGFDVIRYNSEDDKEVYGAEFRDGLIYAYSRLGFNLMKDLYVEKEVFFRGSK